MTRQHLLPSNATTAEKALSASLDRDAVLGPGADAIARWRYARPLPAGFGPYLVDELQLGPIRSYFETDEATVDAGWPWLKLRGTLGAVETALSWVAYEAALVEAPVLGRRKWNRYQIAMGELPLPLESERLLDAEYLASLSDPARSVFWRGFHGYDVRALEWSNGRWGETIWGDDSGVRIEGGQTKWSHGREHGPIEATATATNRSALGLDDLAAGTIGWSTPLTWAQVGHLTWAEPTLEQIAVLLARVVSELSIYVGFFDAGGDLIGARRAIHVTPAPVFGGLPVPADQTVLEITARTGFGDGAGTQVASVAALFDVRSARGPGDLWVAPNDLIAKQGAALADLTIGNWPISEAPDQGPTATGLTLTETIREHLTMRVRLI